MKIALAFSLLLISILSFSQTDSSKKLSFSGYIEAYYVKDFSRPSNHRRPSFFFIHSRANEANFNLVLAKIAYNARQLRFNAGIILGTYPVDGLAAEPVVLNRTYELNAGIKLGTKKDIWLDGGIMPSHIGFETILGRDCPTLTRSILAENSPYYQTGARLSYTTGNKKLYLGLLALNGWNRIANKNDKGSFGTGLQLTIKSSDKFIFNYSNYLGNGAGTKKFRHYHNIYAIFKPSDKLELIGGFDIGFQDITGDNKMETLFSTVLITSYAVSKRVKVVARAEYYDDKNGIMINTPGAIPFQTWGFSGNIDYRFLNNCMFRAEYRLLQSRYEVFINNNEAAGNNKAVTFALIAGFN